MQGSLQSVTETFFDPGATEMLIERADAPHARFSLVDDMLVTRGDVNDWGILKHLHYKEANLPMGPKFWKLTLAGETIGVLVTASPKGLLKERHLVFPKVKPVGGDTKIINTQRYHWINANIRVISRFVVDTMYRGIGCGYRMMNLVSRLEGKPIMEIQSSMSKFNLFGQKAGFRFVKPINATKFEIGLKFFRAHFDASPQDFEAMLAELEAKPAVERDALLQACRKFYYQHSALEKTGNNRDRGLDRVDAMSARQIIKGLQQITLASPMYGVWKNPDKGRALPASLPLSAFDRQGPTEPLVLT